MAATYPSVSSHPLLSATSKALVVSDPSAFASQQELAEILLGLSPPAVTEAVAASRLSLALALQINFQLAQGIDPLIEEFAQSSHSNQMVRYRDTIVNPQAAQIVAEVITSEELGDNFGVLTSLRTRG